VEEAAEACNGGGRGRSSVVGHRMQRWVLVGRCWEEEAGALTGGGATRGISGSSAHQRGGTGQRR
jgi:hypothetical protein